MTFKKILCPTDFSAGADQALRVAVQLATDSGAELVLAHCWFIPTSLAMDYPYPPAITSSTPPPAGPSLQSRSALPEGIA